MFPNNHKELSFTLSIFLAKTFVEGGGEINFIYLVKDGIIPLENIKSKCSFSKKKQEWRNTQ